MHIFSNIAYYAFLSCWYLLVMLEHGHLLLLFACIWCGNY